MDILLANSLVDGFVGSNAVGRGIVIIQLCLSVGMVAAIIGKWRELKFVASATRRFLRDFATGSDVLEYYLNRRPTVVSGIELIYKETCERLLKLLAPDTRSLLVGRGTDGNGAAALTSREIELIKSSCEHALDEEETSVEAGMPLIATVVALSPMLGLLGTVIGMQETFAAMRNSMALNDLSGGISTALLTTGAGLVLAIPCLIAYNYLVARVETFCIEMEKASSEILYFFEHKDDRKKDESAEN